MNYEEINCPETYIKNLREALELIRSSPSFPFTFDQALEMIHELKKDISHTQKLLSLFIEIKDEIKQKASIGLEH